MEENLVINNEEDEESEIDEEKEQKILIKPAALIVYPRNSKEISQQIYWIVIETILALEFILVGSLIKNSCPLHLEIWLIIGGSLTLVTVILRILCIQYMKRHPNRKTLNRLWFFILRSYFIALTGYFIYVGVEFFKNNMNCYEEARIKLKSVYLLEIYGLIIAFKGLQFLFFLFMYPLLINGKLTWKISPIRKHTFDTIVDDSQD